jgi:molecular chaperone DnaK (HSP70)
MSNYYIGIDLGTTSCYVTVADEMKEDGDLHFDYIPIPQENLTGDCDYDPLLHSVLFRQIQEDEDPKIIIGKYAYENSGTEEDGRISLNKNHMGTNKVYHFKDGVTMTPVDVSSYYLQQMLKAIKDHIGHGDQVPSLTITIPASFTQAMIEDTMQSAIQAGLDRKQVHFEHEPVAALRTILFDLEKQGVENRFVREGLLNGQNGKMNVLIFDIGGGTLDITIYEVKENIMYQKYRLEPTQLMLSPHTRLGGYRFDAELTKQLIPKYYQEYESQLQAKDITLEVLQDKLKERWRYKAEETKKELSNQYSRDTTQPWDKITVNKRFNIPAALRPEQSMNAWKYEISLAELNEIYAPLLSSEKNPNLDQFTGMILDEAETIFDPIHICLNRANLTKDDIHMVIPVGGMSHLPFISFALNSFFGANKILLSQAFGTDPSKCISKGAAINEYLRRKKQDQAKKLLPHIEFASNVNGKKNWADLIPQKSYVTSSEKFQKTFSKYYPAGKSQLIIPVRWQGKEKGAMILDWPKDLPKPVIPKPITLVITVESNHMLIEGKMIIDPQHHISFVIDDTTLADEIVLENIIGQNQQPQQTSEMSKNHQRKLCESILNNIQSRLIPQNRNAKLERIPDLPLLTSEFKSLCQQIGVDGSFSSPYLSNKFVQKTKEIKEIIKHCTTNQGLGSYLTDAEKETVSKSIKEIQNLISLKINFYLGSIDAQAWSLVITLLGEMKACLQDHLYEQLIDEGFKSSQTVIQNESAKAVGRVGLKLQKHLKDMMKMIENTKFDHHVGTVDGALWGIGRAMITSSEVMKSLKDGDLDKQLDLLFLKSIKPFSENTTICGNFYSMITILILMKGNDFIKSSNVKKQIIHALQVYIRFLQTKHQMQVVLIAPYQALLNLLSGDSFSEENSKNLNQLLLDYYLK